MSLEQRHLHLRGALGIPYVEHVDGREHLVVPVVALIGDQVIHAVNAQTPEWVPRASLEKAPESWNGHPLVLGHPVRDGKQISAHDPAVLEKHGFGTIRQSHMNGPRLGMEALVDPARLELLGQQQLLADLRAGKPIEVSVGAFVTTNGKSGQCNGKPYKSEWVDISPDHLAMLPNGRGACSLEMGCGSGRYATMHLVTAEGFEPLTVDEHEALKALRDIPQSERDKMDASDFAGPHQSFPIKTQADVDAASHLIGKSDNPGAVKAKVITIAKRKGLKIPDAWRAAEGFEALSNPEGINQYSHGAASDAHREASQAHDRAAKAERNGDGNASSLKAEARQASIKAEHASIAAEHASVGQKDALGRSMKDDHKGSSLAGRAREAGKSGDHVLAANLHERASSHHMGQTVTKSVRMKGLSMNLKSLRAKMLALFDTPSEAASEEAAELVGYNTLRSLFDQVSASYDEASRIVDDLIADEVDDPTETTADEAAEEEVESARLEAVQVLCAAMYATLNSVMSLTSSLLATDMSEADDVTPRYMEQWRTLDKDEHGYGSNKRGEGGSNSQSTEDFVQSMADKGSALDIWMAPARQAELHAIVKAGGKVKSVSGDIGQDEDKVKNWQDKKVASMEKAGFKLFDEEHNYDSHELIFTKAGGKMKGLIGKSISAKNLTTIQAAHDTAHEMHGHLVNLGAACNGMKLLSAGTCKCGGISAGGDDHMDRTARIAALLKNEHNPLKDQKTLEANTDEGLRLLEVHCANAATLKTAADALKTDAEKAAADLKVAQDEKAVLDAKLKAAESKELTEDEFLKAAPPTLKTLIERQKAQDAARKATLVASLKAAQSEFTEEELTAEPLDRLERMARAVKVETPVDFSGRGLPRVAGETKDTFAAPDPYADGVKALQAQNVN
jgi:hypothetical protein